MAKPAFVYAFDNLGPSRFVELCGLLLASRFKGFLLSGPGPDGGVDGETEPALGELRLEEPSLLGERILPLHGLIVFQFKHKVVARVGESASRTQLLNLYKSARNRVSEVNKSEIVRRKPEVYVLVTNVEVNAEFRSRFGQVCRKENPEIAHYQVIGLDEIEAWVEMERTLRHMYLPTLFVPPRFHLEVKLQTGFVAPFTGSRVGNRENVLAVSILNVGAAESYPSSIKFRNLTDGAVGYGIPFPVLPGQHDPMMNPILGTPLPPGRSQVYRYPFDLFRNLRREARESFFLSDVMVFDEIDNVYSTPVSEVIRSQLMDEE